MFDNFILQNTKTGNQVEFNFEEGETPTPSSDVSNSTVAFTEAQTRTNIATGEKLSVICGKIKKFFADLKTVAFTGSYNDLENKPTIPTVNNATLTIKQGGTTKGTFTANASTDVEIDLDAGGGGGSEYTAGDGITITNNVISVTNPINKVTIEEPTTTSIPCFYNDDGTFYKLDGTAATLSDCLDLGEFNHSFGEFLYLRYILDVASATFQDFDWSTQSHTEDTFSDIEKDTGFLTVYITTGDLFDTYLTNNVVLSNGVKNDVFPFILGKKNGHLYLCIASNAYGGIATNQYAESMTTDSFEIQLLGF